ncbi:MAG TPA: P-II family nitrogen regulator [Cytophagaceae bacterium]|jgi:nitrogen regulatory protein PII
MKKIDIVIEHAFLDKLVHKLEDLNIGGYTVLDVVGGRGLKSGKVKDYGVTEINRMNYIFILCSVVDEENIISNISPFIEKAGGIMACSDVTSFYPKRT